MARRDYLECKISAHGYHNDEDILTVQDDDYGIRQKCRCGTEIAIRKTPKGQLVDNDIFMEFHMKDYLQSGSKEFRRVYGIEQEIQNAKIREQKKRSKQEKQDLKLELEEKRKFYTPETYKKNKAKGIW